MDVDANPNVQPTVSEVAHLMGPYPDDVAVGNRPSDSAHVRARQLMVWLMEAEFPYEFDVNAEPEQILKRLKWVVDLDGSRQRAA